MKFRRLVAGSVVAVTAAGLSLVGVRAGADASVTTDVSRLRIVDASIEEGDDEGTTMFVVFSQPLTSRQAGSWRARYRVAARVTKIGLAYQFDCSDNSYRQLFSISYSGSKAVGNDSTILGWSDASDGSAMWRLGRYTCDLVGLSDTYDPALEPAAPLATLSPVTTARPALAPVTTLPPPSTVPPGPVFTTTFQTVHFDGAGSSVTPSFDIPAGFTVFRFVNLGTSNYFADLLDQNGKQVDYLVNEIGRFEGSVPALIPTAGRYSLKFRSDAAWSVDVDQPRARSGAALPQIVTGVGMKVVGPFSAKGVVRVSLNHDGKSNFYVQPWSATGSGGGIVNVIGNYAGETTFTAPDTPFWMEVDADGNWALNMRPF
jgi:hypothetical protein